MNTVKCELTPEKLAGMIDHTLLKPFVSNLEFKQLCMESMEYGFKMVAINPAAVRICSEYLEGSKVLIGAAIGFPLGQNTIEAKVFETEDAIAKGAHEIDYVINIVELKNRNYTYVEEEMLRIVAVCRKNNVTSKVIFENCYLTEEEKRILCEMAHKIKPDFIKTSTGMAEWGAKVEDVRLMKQLVRNAVKVKAAGGVRDLATVMEMIHAGAERIGTSAGVKIIEELKSKGGA